MSISPESRTLTEDILARAVEDWITPADVISVCLRSNLKNAEDSRDLAIGLVARLIATGLLVPGDVTQSGHRPWDCSSAEAINRITVEWSALQNPVMVLPGEIVWLDTSPEGEQIGEAILHRESE